ncbi:FAD binding domain-containing protein [Pleurostoma richardsiae]|uniref:FAD binding domain-containing protein n=1 Tax=Pleurostoma richardsiae TaxID=41990 RepID=A0AA38S1J5_9PEZI|nr:FAD binding domain-containing protein [Pleurostoma richardsiae]
MKPFIQRSLCSSVVILFLATGAIGDSCCAKLSSTLPDAVFFPDSAAGGTYEGLNQRWSGTSILAPGCIFRPSSSQELSTAVQILTADGPGNETACQFAIKSGGHMAVPGANDINEGVSINLVWLNETSVSEDKSFVTLGAGGTWSNAYATLTNDGIAFPGGLCGGTGIGGLSLGGGESLFQPKVGWLIDNVLNYEVVLASGEIVNANQTSNPDLYRALKGGSSNFGIVTKVDVAAFPFTGMWAGQIIVPAIEPWVSLVLAATTNFTANNNDNVNAGIQVVFTYLSNGTAVIDIAIASTDGTVNPEILQNFTSLQPQILNTVGVRSLPSLVAEVDLVQPDGFRDLGATVTFKNDLATLDAVQAVTNEIYSELTNVTDMDFLFNYVPQPKVIETHSAARGGNVLGLEAVDHDQIVAFLTPRWLDAAYDQVMYQAADSWVERASAAAAALGTLDSFVYLNFAAASQKPICSYGADNVAFLREVALQYDPGQVFQRLVPGGFKVSQTC